MFKMGDNVETELFINMIKVRRSIWDPTSEEYKDKNLRKNQWIEICTTFYPDFEKLVPREKGHIGEKMQKKWKHLRDSYVRYYRNKKKTRDGNKRVKTYLYARSLDFLKEILDQRTTDSSLQAEGEIKEISNQPPHTTDFSLQASVNQAEPGNEMKETDVEKIDNSPIHPEIIIPRRSGKRKRNIGEKIEIQKNSLHKEKIIKESSSDDMDFFRSLLPLVNTLSLRQKLKFRSDVMKTAVEYSKISEKSRVSSMLYPTFGFQHLPERPSNQHLYNSMPYLSPYQQMPVFSTSSASSTHLPPGNNITISEPGPQKESFPLLESMQTKVKRDSQVISPENFSNSSNHSSLTSDDFELNLN